MIEKRTGFTYYELFLHTAQLSWMLNIKHMLIMYKVAYLYELFDSTLFFNKKETVKDSI